MMLPKHVRRKVLAYAGAYALVVTGISVVFAVAEWESPLATALWIPVYILNFGGAFLTFLIQLFVGSGLDTMIGEDWLPDSLWWTWIVATVFVGALAQGLLYSVLGEAVLREYRRRRCA